MAAILTTAEATYAYRNKPTRARMTGYPPIGPSAMLETATDIIAAILDRFQT